jgi:phospholipid/cholesterol/gamma-HCH transport system substrate-binding protein
MKRALAIAVCLAVAVVAVIGTGASSGKKSNYKVRAIFDNAVSVIPGEDVKIAGVKVGKISHLDVTKQEKAAVTLEITEAGFQDFRKDATCIIRPQSLIGEKFVDCTPTQPRQPGQNEAPPLQKIKKGQGKGEYLLPVTQTSTPVDLDLIGDVLRRPYRERLSIVLNELGTGLAGRGSDLREVITRANPALKQTDKVLKILGDQNQILANLVKNSDTVIAPLARDRRQVADFISQSADVARATAERRADLERNIQKLPEFLRQLRPTMARLGALSDEATPVLANLHSAAPSLNRFIRELGPFSEASTPALNALGDASQAGIPALRAFNPRITELRRFSAFAKPVAANLAALTTSLKNTGGIERLLDYAFFQVAAVNGFDQYGHYLRAGLMVNLCSTYAITRDPTCSANFGNSAGPTSAAAARLRPVDVAGRDPELVAEDRILHGQPAGATGPSGATGTTGSSGATGSSGPAQSAKNGGGSNTPLRLPSIGLPGSTPDLGGSSSTDKAAGIQKVAAAAPTGTSDDPTSALMDYLFGNGN